MGKLKVNIEDCCSVLLKHNPPDLPICRSKTPTPLTGTVKRMKHLPYIRHTVHRRKASDVNSDEEEEEEQGKPEDPPRWVQCSWLI